MFCKSCQHISYKVHLRSKASVQIKENTMLHTHPHSKISIKGAKRNSNKTKRKILNLVKKKKKNISQGPILRNEVILIRGEHLVAFQTAGKTPLCALYPIVFLR